MLLYMSLLGNITPVVAWGLVTVGLFFFMSRVLLSTRPLPNYRDDESDEYIHMSSGFKLSKLPLPKEAPRRPKPNAHKDNVPNSGPPVLNLETLYRPDLFGMKNYEMDVLKFLKYETTSLLGIYGMRGVGKSTLMRLVYTSTRRDHSFHYVFFVEAGIDFTPDILEGILARNVGLNQSPTVPTNKLLCSFLRDESFVLLIDDVRVIFDLAVAGLPMPLGPQQKVIFTTRNESICAEMGTAGNIVRMQCLEEEVAWDLFKHNVGAEIIYSNLGIEDIAKQIVAECRGYPSAICITAQSMSTKTDLSQWMIAYEMLNIKRSPLREIQGANSEGYPCLDFFEDELGFLSKMIMAAT